MDLKQLMCESPFHRWLGVELVRVDADEIEVRLPYRAEFAGEEGGTNIHGGIIATLADITACFAIMSQIDRDVPSIDLHVDYLRMAPVGHDLVATGRAVKVGRTLGIADVQISTDEGRVIAIGRAKVVTSAPNRETLTRMEGS
ncbi:MAG: PaaI family thioesterase [Anaerolineae bacterium]|nr:PaaI family thioesterase [Anaerolineae bacterium]